MFSYLQDRRYPKRSTRADAKPSSGLTFRVPRQVIERLQGMLIKADSVFDAILDAGHYEGRSFLGVWSEDLSETDQETIFTHYSKALIRHSETYGAADSRLETIVGLCYLQGLGVERDDATGYAHISRAAEAGYAPAVREKASYELEERASSALVELLSELPPAIGALGLANNSSKFAENAMFGPGRGLSFLPHLVPSDTSSEESYFDDDVSMDDEQEPVARFIR